MIQTNDSFSQSADVVNNYAQVIASRLAKKCEQGVETTSIKHDVLKSDSNNGFIQIHMAVSWVDKAGDFDHNAKVFLGSAFIDSEKGDGFFLITKKHEEGVIINTCYESVDASNKAYFKDNYGIDAIKFVDFGEL